jgi:hypothetical protein
MRQRHHIPQTSDLDELLAKDSQNLRKQAEGTPAGVAREDLLRKARQAERATRVLEWLSSPGLLCGPGLLSASAFKDADGATFV